MSSDDGEWTSTPEQFRARFDQGVSSLVVGNQGVAIPPAFPTNQSAENNDALEPAFRAVDGTNRPLADLSTPAARESAYSLLLSRGVFRVGLPMTNLRVMFDGRDTLECERLTTSLAATPSSPPAAPVNTPNVGTNSQGRLMDIGASDEAVSAELPTSDPGRALVTGRWADLNRMKVPSPACAGRTRPLLPTPVSSISEVSLARAWSLRAPPQSIPTHAHARSQVCCALYCLWARATLLRVAEPASRDFGPSSLLRRRHRLVPRTGASRAPRPSRRARQEARDRVERHAIQFGPRRLRQSILLPVGDTTKAVSTDERLHLLHA